MTLLSALTRGAAGIRFCRKRPAELEKGEGEAHPCDRHRPGRTHQATNSSRVSGRGPSVSMIQSVLEPVKVDMGSQGATVDASVSPAGGRRQRAVRRFMSLGGACRPAVLVHRLSAVVAGRTRRAGACSGPPVPILRVGGNSIQRLCPTASLTSQGSCMYMSTLAVPHEPKAARGAQPGARGRAETGEAAALRETGHAGEHCGCHRRLGGPLASPPDGQRKSSAPAAWAAPAPMLELPAASLPAAVSHFQSLHVKSSCSRSTFAIHISAACWHLALLAAWTRMSAGTPAMPLRQRQRRACAAGLEAQGNGGRPMQQRRLSRGFGDQAEASAGSTCSNSPSASPPLQAGGCRAGRQWMQASLPAPPALPTGLAALRLPLATPTILECAAGSAGIARLDGASPCSTPARGHG